MNRILDYIEDPNQLHTLTNEELSLLADEIREEIVNVTSEVGGHVSASLGAVELILSVHSLINSPKDKFIFDVGHQAYAHKLVTGRNDSFKTLRKLNGISGFTKPTESKHDVHYSGHASDSLSIALGLAKARSLRGTDEKIVTLIGDASIAGGMSFEALNQIGQEKLPMVIIFNENDMSISPNVGGFVSHLKSLRVSSGYKDARNAFLGIKNYGKIGNAAYNFAHKTKESFKHLVIPDPLMFEKIGITCTPIIDGHNIVELKKTLRMALNYDRPVLVHVFTHKGAGYKPAAKDPELFHGIGPYDIKSGKPKKNNTYTFTKAFGDSVFAEAKDNDKVVALTAAMAGGTGLKPFAEKFNDRFIDVGIAEEHLLGIASGLAIGGYKPVVAVYSAFLQRSFDQIVTNIALPNLDVVICVDRAGLVGPDGVSHHGLFDMAISKNIPNMTVLAPSNAHDLKCALHTAVNNHGPYLIRYPRGEALEFDKKITKLKKSIVVKKGEGAAILAFGDCVIDAIAAVIDLDVRVVDMRFVKPLDVSAIKKACETGKVITVENGILSGGAGEAVLAEIKKLGLNPKFKSLGIDDKFIAHGTINELKHIAGIDAEAIRASVIE